MDKQKKVAVVGAGIAGLSAAYELQKAGLDVTVFESSSIAGGRMQSIKKDGWTFDSGANFLQDNYTLLKSYANELNIRWESIPSDSLRRMIREGVPNILTICKPSDVFRLSFLSLRSRCALALWCLRLRFGYQYDSWFELSNITFSQKHSSSNAHEYLEKNVSPEVAIHLADAFTSIMQFHRVREIDVDALNSLMQIFVRPYDKFSIMYTPEGIAEIPRLLGEAVGIQYNHPVQKIEPAEGTVLVDDLPFDTCVVATTADVGARIFADNEILKDFLESVRYASTITIAFRMPISLFPHRINHTYISYYENQIVGGYTNEGKKPGATSSQDETLVNIYLHEEAIKLFSSLSDKEVIERVLEELPKVFPEIKGHEDRLTFHDLKRWDKAMPKFTANHVRRVKEFESKHQGKDNIYLVGDYMNGPWTEGAARSGKRVAKLIAQTLNSETHKI